MGIIWVIEKPDKGMESLAASLQGDFPVRLFGSFESFMMLQKMTQNVLPDAVLIDTTTQDYDLKWMDEIITCYLPQAKRIYVMKEEKAEVAPSPQRFFISSALGPLKLTREIKSLVTVKEKAANVCRYKTLCLDFEKLILQILPSHDTIYLTLKEARLLKFFIENPGRCITRDEIQNSVWESTTVAPRTIDSQVSRLRKHLAATDVEIESVYGGGYLIS